jgi:hypothetical protein
VSRNTKPTTPEERTQWRHNIEGYGCTSHATLRLLDDVDERDELLERCLDWMRHEQQFTPRKLLGDIRDCLGHIV